MGIQDLRYLYTLEANIGNVKALDQDFLLPKVRYIMVKIANLVQVAVFGLVPELSASITTINVKLSCPEIKLVTCAGEEYDIEMHYSGETTGVPDSIQIEWGNNTLEWLQNNGIVQVAPPNPGYVPIFLIFNQIQGYRIDLESWNEHIIVIQTPYATLFMGMIATQSLKSTGVWKPKKPSFLSWFIHPWSLYSPKPALQVEIDKCSP
jgi:hypothetical protein